MRKEITNPVGKWWVLAPLWMPVVLAIGIVLVLLLILLIVAAIAACSK